ncbi:hypothetical protein B0T26DRAFT_866306 [Lasiosphaeria miniovina]|uniref:DUF7336 domain-containing protein n=1 Tax=Lasiosphaeria miniovina TaxID=1954250 RepID=A0AA40BEU4_9PEZI|nr:uncharacterized protein B0T26DRAFT_866306 [Lasiosphaeria miniovina]KAK0732896.1 hypothetical protein B0T26DRAFT_866306 [Lasiosphaeria miniovina]
MSSSRVLPSHKRTSSGAENQDTDQPPFKQAREARDSLSGVVRSMEPPEVPENASSASSSSDGSDASSLLNGVYIVQYSISNMHNDENDIRILGVYVSEEDAEAQVSAEKADLESKGASPGDIEDLYQSGWTWEDHGYGKIRSCSVQFHKLIWPSQRSGASSSSSSASSVQSGRLGHGEGDMGTIFEESLYLPRN